MEQPIEPVQPVQPVQPAAVELVCGLDTGSQSTRAFLFRRGRDAPDGPPVGSAQTPVSLEHPGPPGWVELDAVALFQSIKACLAEAYKEAERAVKGPVKVVALGLTNQRETTVVWSKTTGQPLHKAIMWMDTRTSELCGRFAEEFGKDYFRPVTGLPIANYFSAFKFKWLYEHVEVVRAAMDADDACFGTIDSWILYCMTGGANGGVHLTDVTNASRTLLMSLETCSWHEPFLPLFNMRHSALPRIVSNAEVYGHFLDAPEPLLGVPISGCLGDQMAALLVPGLESHCIAKNTYGSGAFLVLDTGPGRPVISKAGLISTLCHKLGPGAPVHYALEGAMAVAGLGLSWLCELGLLRSAQDADEVASQVPDTNGVFFVPAFTGLFAPRWDDTARGVILGLSTDTKRPHIVRALIEAICFQSREVLEAMQQDAAVAHVQQLRVDGGATRCNLLMQLQADVLGIPVVRSNLEESTVLGAVLAAGMGAGLWTADSIFRAPSHGVSTFQPSMPREAADHIYECWLKCVPHSHALAELSPAGPEHVSAEDVQTTLGRMALAAHQSREL